MAENKMTTCKSCGHEIFAKGKVTCPNCGKVNKPPIYKRPWFIIIIVLLVLGMAGAATDDSDTTTSVDETTEAVAEVEEDETTEVVEDIDYTQEELESLEDTALLTFQQNFVDIADVSLDRENKIFKFNSTDEDFIAGVELMLNGNADEGVLDAWNTMALSYNEMSKTLIDVLGTGYALSILSPFNEENTILYTVDGVTVYNVVDDL